MRYHIGYSSTKPDAYVYLRRSYVDSSGHSKKGVVKSYGRKDRLLAQDAEALDKIEAEADQLNAALKSKNECDKLQQNPLFPPEVLKSLGDSTKITGDEPVTLSLGMLPLRHLWNELGLEYKFDRIQRSTKIQYDLAETVRQLVFLRVLLPASKRRTCYPVSCWYLTDKDMTQTEAYRSLDVLDDCKKEVINLVNRRIDKIVGGRNVEVCLYDITTYAFESTDADALRNFGYSKDKKFNEVQVVMALGADFNGIPLDYKLFNGSQSEGATLVPFMDELKKKFGCRKFTVVADRALCNKANVDAMIKFGNDFVMAFNIKGASEDLKQEALSESGRIPMAITDSDGTTENGWYKEIIRDEELDYYCPKFAFEKLQDQPLEEARAALVDKIKDGSKKAVVKSVRKLRYIITYSDRRAEKDRKDRNRLIKKAQTLINNPSLYQNELKRGGRSYVVVENEKPLKLSMNNDLIEKQKQFDGMHVLETSIFDEDAKSIIKKYRQLWKIEDSFRVMKTQISARPVYVRTEPHVRGHFLMCYLALVLLRLMEYQWRKTHPTAGLNGLVTALNKATITRNHLKGLGTFFGFEGFGPTCKELFAQAKLEVPSYYERGPAAKRLLKLDMKMDDYFRENKGMQEKDS